MKNSSVWNEQASLNVTHSLTVQEMNRILKLLLLEFKNYNYHVPKPSSGFCGVKKDWPRKPLLVKIDKLLTIDHLDFLYRLVTFFKEIMLEALLYDIVVIILWRISDLL